MGTSYSQSRMEISVILAIGILGWSAALYLYFARGLSSFWIPRMLLMHPSALPSLIRKHAILLIDRHRHPRKEELAMARRLRRSPILKLPPELLFEILRYLSPSAILAFRQSSRHIFLSSGYEPLMRGVRKGLKIDHVEMGIVRGREEKAKLKDWRIIPCDLLPKYWCSFHCKDEAELHFAYRELSKAAERRICEARLVIMQEKESLRRCVVKHDSRERTNSKTAID
ncbi:MAG: hypothetical protein M1819_004062 [Sarea resinae]|nr:MAG: hypothetical protein M1819_004062 [Sarea resinae]